VDFSVLTGDFLHDLALLLGVIRRLELELILVLRLSDTRLVIFLL
jgi:hypothetical protein